MTGEMLIDERSVQVVPIGTDGFLTMGIILLYATGSKIEES
jgi:hypothetical protein